MPYDAYGNWVDEPANIDPNDPKLAPPNSVWNEDKGGWDTKRPGQEGYDPTWGGYAATHPDFVPSVATNQGWPTQRTQAVPAPTPLPTTPPPITSPPPRLPPPLPPLFDDGRPGRPVPPSPPPSGGGNFQPGATTNYYNYAPDQQRLIDQLMNRLQAGVQPQPQYGDEVVRLMRLQEERAAQDAIRRAAFEEQLRGSLLDLIKRGQEPVDYEKTANTPEARAFARVQERAMERYRAQAAEQRAAQGIGQNQRGEVSGALGSDIQGGQSDLAEKIAAFQSNLVASQINRRRGELMQALQMGAGMLSNDQQQSIRRELAGLDAALHRETFHGDLGLRSFLGGGQLSLGLLGTLNQNQQFYDRLGYDVGLSEAMLNQNALNPLFGGYQLR